MLTKKLQFSEEVLTVIRAMQWNETGTIGKITMELERKLYTEVNKALSVMGGKWVKAKGGHVFEDDPRPMVEGLMESGHLVVEKDGFFETPKELAQRMVEIADLREADYILEPEAGMGAIAHVILEDASTKGLNITLWLIEKNQKRSFKLDQIFGMKAVVFCADILDNKGYQKFDKIIMNPPFEELQDIDHVRHAYSLLFPHGVLVAIMSEAPFFRDTQKAKDFREWLKTVNSTHEQLPEGTFKSSGTGVNTRLVVIQRGRE